MLRTFALAAVLALTAGAALAQPRANGYSLPPAESPYPPAAQGYPPGAQGYGPGGGGRWGGDPEARTLRQAMRAACATDLSTYCADAGQGGRGAEHQCMMANAAKFSSPCQAAIAQLHAHIKAVREGAKPGMPPPPPPS